MRGFLLAGLEMRLGFWPGAAISSLVWAALHGVGGVLIPFVAEGIVLCWIRRRTGSVRTGIALHAAQNTVATLVTGAGLLAAPPLIVLVSSLVVTRAESRDALTMASRTAYAWVVETAQALAGRLAGLPPPPVGAWVVAGLALGAGVSLVSVHAVFDAGGGGFETAGRLLTAVVAMPTAVLAAGDRRAGVGGAGDHLSAGRLGLRGRDRPARGAARVCLRRAGGADRARLRADQLWPVRAGGNHCGRAPAGSRPRPRASASCSPSPRCRT